MVVDLSLQEQAERIRHWINNEPDGYFKLITQLKDTGRYGSSMNFIAIVLDEPEMFPRYIHACIEAIATLKLIGE